MPTMISKLQIKPRTDFQSAWLHVSCTTWRHILTNQPTTWNKLLSQKLTVSQLVRLPAFMEHVSSLSCSQQPASQSWARSIHSTSIRLTFILSFWYRSSQRSPSTRFPPPQIYAFLFFPMRTTCPVTSSSLVSSRKYRSHIIGTKQVRCCY